MHLGADFGGVELDHVVTEALDGGDDLALQEQEANDVGGAAIQLGSDVLGGRAALDDDLPLGHRRAARLPGGHLGRLELFDVASTPSSDLALGPARPPPPRAGPPLRLALAAGHPGRSAGPGRRNAAAGSRGTAGARGTGAGSRAHRSGPLGGPAAGAPAGIGRRARRRRDRPTGRDSWSTGRRRDRATGGLSGGRVGPSPSPARAGGANGRGAIGRRRARGCGLGRGDARAHDLRAGGLGGGGGGRAGVAARNWRGERCGGAARGDRSSGARRARRGDVGGAAARPALASRPWSPWWPSAFAASGGHLAAQPVGVGSAADAVRLGVLDRRRGARGADA